MQEKRPLSSVILEPGVLDLVLSDAKEFLRSKKWYADRGASLQLFNHPHNLSLRL